MQEKKTSHRRCLVYVLTVLALLFHATTFAAGIPYRVDIQAPDALRKLLTQHLRIVELRASPDVNLDQLRSVYRRTPAEIEELLATEGYFSPKVTSSLEGSAGNWVVTYNVDPGPRVRVKTVFIEFTGGIIAPGEDNERLRRKTREAWYLDEGTVFRQADWDDAKRIVLQKLLAERYPAARITNSEAKIDASTNLADLSVTLESGPSFHVGELEISGLQRYRPAIVERLNTIEPGSPYSLDKLQEFQQRLQDTGYFSTVLVSVDTDSSTPDRAPIKVTVVEGKPRKVSFGVGYSTDTKNRFSVEYEDRNLFNRGWRNKGRLQLETLRQEFSGEIAFPRTGGGYDPRVFASYIHEDIQGQDTRKFTYGGAVGETRGNIERIVSLQQVYEDQSIDGAPSSIRQAVFGNFSWTQRAVDNVLFPTRGYLLNLQLGAAPSVLPKSESFVRSYARGAYYLPAGSKGTFLFRTELGYVAARSSDSIPSDFLFRTGGDTSVRGFPYQGIGIEQGSAIVGGRVLGVASAEYIHWFTHEWGGAVFYDTGDATDRIQDLDPKHGYGVGARWRSPVGSLNLDVAYGQEREEFRFHFTVGIAF